ncbi:MAG: molecular chaperone TorD family protein [Vicinamibacterales bacterium]
MTPQATLLPLAARVLTYPGPETPALLAECRAVSAPDVPDATRRLREFASAMEGHSIEAMQERFTGAFDFDPKCTLDIGWHLFGENYDRGDFLVRMRGALAAHGIEEGVDLPDHLPHLLILLDRMAPAAGAELATGFVLPAVAKILDGLGGQENPYELVIAAVQTLVSTHACVAPGGVSHV